MPLSRPLIRFSGKGLLHLKLLIIPISGNGWSCMDINRITSRRNTLIVEAVKLLSDTTYRKQSNLIAAEGTKLLFDALASGAEVEFAVATEDIGSELEGSRINRLAVVPEQLFKSISTQKTPQGVVFFAVRPAAHEKLEYGSYVVLDGVQDPGNVGTVIRTAAAFGISGVIVCGSSADPFGPKAVRASMGAVFREAVCIMEYNELVENLNKLGVPLVAAMPSGNASDIRELGIHPAAVVVGSEGSGVSRVLLEKCSAAVAIPMVQGTESLNAAVAASILIWELSGRKL